MTSGWSTAGRVEVNGVRLGLRQCGDPAGTPVVLLHGTGSNSRTWDRFAARLDAAGHRAIAVDLRGHATSDRTAQYRLTDLRDDVLGVLELLDLRDAVLVGHSVGGYAALAAALHAPGRIDRLVLEDLAAPPRHGALLTGAGPLQLLAAAATIVVSRRGYALRAMRSIFGQLSRPDPAWWSRLAEVTRPTLVLSGGPASMIPPARLAEVTAAIPGARLATIPVGHRVHSLDPDTFATEVLGFLREPATHPA